MKKETKEDILHKFRKFTNSFPNDRLKAKMLAVCKEKPEYMADELLLFSEEIHSQVSAYDV